MIQTSTERNQQFIDRCKQLHAEIGIDEIKFGHGIKVKPTPHHELFRIFGATVKKDVLYVEDYYGEWHPLEANQANVFYIATSLMGELNGVKNAKAVN